MARRAVRIAIGTGLFVAWLVLARCLPGAAGGPAVVGPELQMAFIDVKEGDAIWVRTPEGRDYLIDGGQSWAGVTVTTYLQQHGVRRLDGVVVTHPDADHVGGLVAVLQAISVTQVIHNGQPASTTPYARFRNEVQGQAIPTVVARAEQMFSWGDGVTVTVLNPSAPLRSATNDNSVVLRLVYGQFEVMLPGDVPDEVESLMMGRGFALQSDVLKVAHHGSSGSTSSAWLAAVRPQTAVLTVQANDRYHPAPVTLDRLAAAGVAVYRTDVHGTVRVSSDGAGYRVDWGPEVTVTPTATRTATVVMTPTPTPTRVVFETRSVVWLPVVMGQAASR